MGALVRPIVEQAGLELVEAGLRGEAGRQVLRVTVDREGGVDLDTLTDISERVVRRLDLEDFGSGRYELEVSSPGIERPLKTPEQFARFAGTIVKIKTLTAVEGAHVHTGTLTAVSGDRLSISVDGAERTINMNDITSARTVADWVAELRGSRA